MLYLLVGNDSKKRTQRTKKITQTLKTKRPDALYIEFHSDTFNEHSLLEHLNTQGLFDEKSIVRFIGACEDVTNKQLLINHAQSMSESDNAFVITEEKLTKNEIGKFEKAGATIELFEQTSTAKPTDMFALADLLLKRDKQKLLMLFYQYINQGHAAEELVGILVWQLKSLNLALSSNQTDSGLKPFVYNKCLKAGWGQKQANKTYHTLISEYHQSRRGGLPLSERVEKFILEL